VTTPARRAIAGLLAVLATFEREILQESTKAGTAGSTADRCHTRCRDPQPGRKGGALDHDVEKSQTSNVSAADSAGPPIPVVRLTDQADCFES